MDGQPDGLLLRIGPFHAMPAVLINMEIVPGVHCDGLIPVFETENGLPFQKHDPLMFILIIPEASGRTLTAGNNSFHAESGCLKQVVKPFITEIERDIGKEIFQQRAPFSGARQRPPEMLF